MMAGMSKEEHGWEMEHSPYTPKGSVESAGKFARAASSRPRRPEVRRFLIVIVVALVGLVVVMAAGALLTG
jgi:hypothetical protein